MSAENIPISDCRFPPRLLEALISEGCATVGDIGQVGDRLFRVPGLGGCKVNRLRAELMELGIPWRESEEDREAKAKAHLARAKSRREAESMDPDRLRKTLAFHEAKAEEIREKLRSIGEDKPHATPPHFP